MGLDNPVHILILLIVLLLVFGAKRLPEVGRSLGDGMRGFKESLSGAGARDGADRRATGPRRAPLRARARAGEQRTCGGHDDAATVDELSERPKAAA